MKTKIQVTKLRNAGRNSKSENGSLATAAFCFLFSAFCSSAHAQGSAFTYQGRLDQGGSPANGIYDLRFAIYDAASDGVSQGPVLTHAATAVSNGLFTVTLDFGNQFPGAARWLEIGVRTNGVGGFVPLAPRQALLPAPYAIHSARAVDVVNGSVLNPLFIGTTTATPLEFFVAGARAMRFEPDPQGPDSPNVIGGAKNTVTSGVSGATISGGGNEAMPNRVTDDYGTISGGRGNQAGDGAGTTSNQPLATVGGGLGNRATGGGATIGGGRFNMASGTWSTVGGGGGNTASREFSTVPGGFFNQAGGDSSFAAGRSAIVRDAATVGNAIGDRGTFVWADSTFSPFVFDGENRFLVRSTGGARFYSSANLATGVGLAPNDGSWTSVSDRNLKENIVVVDGREVLERLSEIPIATWNYKAQDPSIRHIGPMGQDFHAAFGVGAEPPRINTVDADGVALAAIQGLNQKVENGKQKCGWRSWRRRTPS